MAPSAMPSVFHGTGLLGPPASLQQHVVVVVVVVESALFALVDAAQNPPVQSKPSGHVFVSSQACVQVSCEQSFEAQSLLPVHESPICPVPVCAGVPESTMGGAGFVQSGTG